MMNKMFVIMLIMLIGVAMLGGCAVQDDSQKNEQNPVNPEKQGSQENEGVLPQPPALPEV